MRANWSFIYLLLFIYRSMYSLLGRSIVIPFTSFGDTSRYQGRTTLAFGEGGPIEWLKSSTVMTDTIGRILRGASDGNPLIVNMGFQIIAFIGIVKFLHVLDPKSRTLALIFFVFPSFTLWSSVASKESITVCAMCYLCAYISGFWKENQEQKMSAVIIFAGYIVYLYKPWYFASITFVLCSIFAARYFVQKTSLVLIGVLLSFFLLYMFRDWVDATSFSIDNHFIGLGRSTRPSPWVEQYDVFYHAPYGMLLSLMGPTFSEATISQFHMMAWIESVAIIVLLVILYSLGVWRSNIFYVLIGVIAIFWILFATYPLGAMNPGTAIRYRAGYMPWLVFLAVVVMRQGKISQTDIRGFLVKPIEVLGMRLGYPRR